ncbi:hypothetical protein [Defluviimonas salinarum]|uniref:Uncharacterized protein n=1 Tax=Defluviimonas salinarum TaxID=2992147 RepID=A0ABT3J475_9RHOB|nr:hypothetical protein [Defluviimonas salinarum]MCW3782497.1 hypothetical protein [Defluviimonas salinarum]
MIFPAFDPFDSGDQQTLRHVCLETLKRIGKTRSAFLSTCESRPHLIHQDRAGRLAAFGALLMGATVLSRNRTLPDQDPERFLGALARIGERAAPGSLKAKIQGFLGGAPDGGPGLRERMIPVLATWPGFDRDAYLEGRPQGADFMAEFGIDYPALRELSFEMHKPWTHLRDLETHIDALIPIYRRFEEAAFAGTDPERLAELLGDGNGIGANASPDRDIDTEPAL